MTNSVPVNECQGLPCSRSCAEGEHGHRLPDGLASFLQGSGEDFLQGSGEDLPAFDASELEDLLERQLMLPGLGQERPMAQLPVRLPAPDELADAAERSTVVGQFRALAEWLGPDNTYPDNTYY